MTTQARLPGRPKRRSWAARQDWYFAVALALFVGVGVWFSRAITDFFAPAQKTVSIPALVGQTLSDAIKSADRAHFKVAVLRRTPSDQYPKDVVMRQSPSAGAQVREGRQVSLVVSTGVQIFAMPDLRYESLREVGLDLSHAKLVLGKTKLVASDEVPGGHVVAQDPPPLSSVREGSTVTIEIAKGGAQTIRVPTFAHLTVDEARDAAKGSHVHLGQIVWTPFGRYGPARGIVVAQKPAAGSEIDGSQLVSLQVSAGPRESGYIVRQVHAVVTVPEDAASQGEKSPIARIQVRDETGTWNAYNAYAQPKQRLDFNLTVVGTAELDVFVNEELISSTKLGREPAMQEQQKLGPDPKLIPEHSAEVPAPAPVTRRRIVAPAPIVAPQESPTPSPSPSPAPKRKHRNFLQNIFK